MFMISWKSKSKEDKLVFHAYVSKEEKIVGMIILHVVKYSIIGIVL